MPSDPAEPGAPHSAPNLEGFPASGPPPSSSLSVCPGLLSPGVVRGSTPPLPCQVPPCPGLDSHKSAHTPDGGFLGAVTASVTFFGVFLGPAEDMCLLNEYMT